MSDYCGQCRYKVSQKTGAGACPLNALYWDFIARHAERLRRNPRMAQMYRTWERFTPEVQSALRADAKHFLDTLPA
jgi:deoxyribodipyrimidine photolyase-related protein